MGFVLFNSFKKTSLSPDWARTHCVHKDDLEPLSPLPLLSKCWVYRHVPPSQFMWGWEANTGQVNLYLLSHLPSPGTVLFCFVLWGPRVVLHSQQSRFSDYRVNNTPSSRNICYGFVVSPRCFQVCKNGAQAALACRENSRHCQTSDRTGI